MRRTGPPTFSASLGPATPRSTVSSTSGSAGGLDYGVGSASMQHPSRSLYTPGPTLRTQPATAPRLSAATSGGGIGAASANTNRVRVAVRVRPPFEEEGTTSVAHIPTDTPPGPAGLPRCLQLDVSPGKRREFSFDACFGPEHSNADVYNVIGGPVVAGVLEGIPGTILAYGQTGSGKTHSLGILTRVAGESGIIPRALSHVFGAIAQEEASGTGRVFAVTASFAQIYLDTVQDLLVQGGGGGGGDAAGGGGTSLPVREDPVRGFYVEGLSEYAVRSFDEATALLNWGLEHRVLGATRMNATSSRSHTILTVRVEVRVPATGARLDGSATSAACSSGSGSGGALTGHVATRAQLMICDLAGSERVRRTSSRGARLDEARAINGSLHTLGQVIAALSAISSAAAAAAAHGGGAAAAAASSRFHVPWRDSKLTRLLHGNLGGSSNTFLLATLGPAARDATETLSTLLFASRCMRVAAVPVAALAASQADYAELAARLQARLSSAEARHAAEVEALCGRYEAALSAAADELTSTQHALSEAQRKLALCGEDSGSSAVREPDAADTTAPSLACFSVSLFGDANSVTASPQREHTALLPGSPVRGAPAAQSLLLCQWAALEASVGAVLLQVFRARRAGAAWVRAIGLATTEEAARTAAEAAMATHDLPSPALRATLGSVALRGDGALRYGSPAAALLAVHRLHPSNVAGGAPATASVALDADREGDDGGEEEEEGSLAWALRIAGGSDAAAAQLATAAGAGAVTLVPLLPTGVRLGAVASAVLAGRLDFGGTTHNGGAGDRPVSAVDALAALEAAMAGAGATAVAAPLIEPLPGTAAASRYPAPDALAAAVAANLRLCDAAARVRDARFDDLKRHAASVEALLRARDEDAANQRAVLRYLVDGAAALRAQLAAERGRPALSSGGGGVTADESFESSVDDAGGELAADPLPLARLAARRETVGFGGSSTGASDAVPAPIPHPLPQIALGVGAGAPARSATPTPPADVGATPLLAAASAPGTQSGAQWQLTPQSRPQTVSAPPAHAAPSVLPGVAAGTGRPPRPPTVSTAAVAQPVPSLVQAATAPLGVLVPLTLGPSQATLSPPSETKNAARGALVQAAAPSQPGDSDSSGQPNGAGGSDEVECIVGRRVVGAHLLYKVHWCSSNSADDEWFAREDLIVDFPHVVKAYETGSRVQSQR